MSKAKSAVPEGLYTMTPHLTLDNAARTIDWYKKALGAEELRRSAGPDGKIMHAELKIGNSHFMLNDVMGGGKGPKAYGGSPASFWLVRGRQRRALQPCRRRRRHGADAAGGSVLGDRAGAIADPEGISWWVATRKEISRRTRFSGATPSSSSRCPSPRRRRHQASGFRLQAPGSGFRLGLGPWALAFGDT